MEQAQDFMSGVGQQALSRYSRASRAKVSCTKASRANGARFGVLLGG